ncbi:MAG: NTP transferase domain-containing protein [Hyphomicrobiales bacterium]|nr:NTP transferase domain-containing protein [Hyphomicrobiales bacterium]MCP5371955.1 NTP transferase domain-containing protein [Hyphomicrobiales bacterium]
MTEPFSPEAVAAYRARMRPQTVLLMAGGPQRRWHGAEPRHLAPLGTGTVIGRTLRQLAQNGVDDPVVVSAAPLPGLEGTAAQPCSGPYPAALAGTRPLWRGAVLVLSADTVFSDGALRAILSTPPAPNHAWGFFGKRGANSFTGKEWSEIYALRFHADDGGRLAAALADLAAAAVKRRKLHELYRALAGLSPADRPYLPPGPLFHDVPDWTDDADSRRDLDNIAACMRQLPGADGLAGEGP